MYNCIFSGHCTDLCCNTSCPALAQTSYLMERNGISMSNPALKLSKGDLQKCCDIIDKSSGRVTSVIVKKGEFTNQTADNLTYCAICENWRGSQMHCTAYNLKFYQYLEELKKSWSFIGNSVEIVDQIKIWTRDAKVLIISNLDFVNFKDLQCQTILELVQSRMNPELTTIIVSPPTTSLVGSGQFFAAFTNMLDRQKVGDTN